MIRALALFALALGACTHTRSSDSRPMIDPGVHFRELTVDGVSHRYAILLPPQLDTSKPVACVVFLNGRGECGTDGTRPLAVGLLPAVMLDSAQWPCVILFPQKPDAESRWEDHESLVLGVIDRARKEFDIDSKRIALTGLSQGGHGTWVIGSRHPDLFSKLAPICGYGDPEAIARNLGDIPIRAFHGVQDNVVPASQSEAIVAKIKSLYPGAPVELRLYPQADHNSWDLAYRSEGLGVWLTSPR